LILFLISFVFFPGLPFHKNPDSHNRTSTDSRPVKGSTLQGTVLDPDGRPVANARVALFSGLVSIEQRSTDSEGRYRLEGLIQGNYARSRYWHWSFRPLRDIELHDAEALNLDLHLKISAVEEQVVVSASLDEALPSQIGSSVSVIAQPENRGSRRGKCIGSPSWVPGVDVSSNGRRRRSDQRVHSRRQLQFKTS